mmetsp:Transcript_11596/g.16913  ORF Transcript_11596/g.16913 Transcript_11596/m.16913 type:complete len:262 (-) Transcript_11596:1806-2591(-)
MLDKADIQWNHIQVINERSIHDKRPFIETWKNCNLHEVDQVAHRLESIAAQTPVAMVGIHLCKTLSPTCIGIVNSMEASHCPFLILAPCCLPRVVASRKRSVLDIRQYETGEEREIRRIAKERRNAAMARRKRAHREQETLTMGDQIGSNLGRIEGLGGMPLEVLADACWKCGEVGHLRADCPSSQRTGKPSLIKPPSVEIDVSGILDSDKPFDTYCNLLSTTLQRNVRVVETGLVNDKAAHQKGNWNNGRKLIYIIATPE